MLAPALHQPPFELGARHVEKNREVEQRRQPRPRLFVEQQVVAFDQHEFGVLRNDRGTCPRQLHRAVEDRDGDVLHLVGADSLQQGLEAGKVEGFRRALAWPQAPRHQDGVVVVEAVHRHDFRLAFRQQAAEGCRQRRLAGAGRPGDGDDDALRLAGALEDGGRDMGDFGHGCSMLPDGDPPAFSQTRPVVKRFNRRAGNQRRRGFFSPRRPAWRDGDGPVR